MQTQQFNHPDQAGRVFGIGGITSFSLSPVIRGLQPKQGSIPRTLFRTHQIRGMIRVRIFDVGIQSEIGLETHPFELSVFIELNPFKVVR